MRQTRNLTYSLLMQQSITNSLQNINFVINILLRLRINWTFLNAKVVNKNVGTDPKIGFDQKDNLSVQHKIYKPVYCKKVFINTMIHTVLI